MRVLHLGEPVPSLGSGTGSEALSNREREVAEAYAAGASYKEIARALGLSPTTIRSHLRTVYGKLGVTSKIELARFLEDAAAPSGPRDSAAMAAELALELDDAVRRERVLAKVLRIISNHDGSLETVIDDVLDHALEICEAEFGILFEYHGDGLVREMRARGISPAFSTWLAEVGTFHVEPTTGVGRAMAERRSISIADVRAGGVYESGSPLRVATVDLGQARSLAAIPMISGNRLIGVFSIYRTRVHPFTERTLDLVQLFADQAVIAIENVRQFRNIQARLEREQGTSEILKLLSRSREDGAPVFDLILRKAIELCGADAAGLTLGRERDDHQRLVASLGMHPKTIAHYDAGHVSMKPTSYAAKAILSGEPVTVADVADSKGYREGDGAVRSLVDDTGMRTSLFVPLMTVSGGIGALVLFRKSVCPYTDEEIALVETFATQAVIAVENAEQFRAIETLNASLEAQVQKQVAEIERMGRLKRFLSPAVANALVCSGDEGRLSSHRALIATLFCDIRGFTAFCERAEPEETIEVLQAYHEEMGVLISSHGGGVDKRMGDGIMVIFNDPLPCEDPAGDAVRLAIAMRERMAELCKRWKRLGHRLGFGVGISLGYATIGMVGSEGRYDYTASGTSVNLAARLCDRAEDGEILLSPRAHTATEDDFSAESSGEIELKGLREPVEVFKLVL